MQICPVCKKNPLKTPTDTRCEDCDVFGYQRWNGKSQRVNTNIPQDDKPPEVKKQCS